VIDGDCAIRRARSGPPGGRGLIEHFRDAADILTPARHPLEP